MNEGTTWRLVSDYIGAGDFLVSAKRAFVGTEYGVQCLPYSPTNLRDWKTDLGSRCIGVTPRGEKHLLASCVGGVFLLTREGEVVDELLSIDELVHPAVLVGPGARSPIADEASLDEVGGSIVTVATTTVTYRPSWRQPSWTYDLRKALGQSVQSVRVVNAFETGGRLVIGAVDYDTGIGRVIVLDPDGRDQWLSPPGPLSEAFPAGDGVFLWCLTGYGKLESSLSRVDGSEVWKKDDMAGVGAALPDGTLAMLVGSNESPRWDNWEYRHVGPGGEVAASLELRGRCAVRPTTLPDGSLVVIGSSIHLDPSSSRVDYTNFFKMPQEVQFQHLVGIREQVREYEVHVHRIAPDGSTAEILYHATGSYSLATPRCLEKHVVFCDGSDLVGVEF